MLVHVVIATAHEGVAQRLGDALDHPGLRVERLGADEKSIRTVRTLSPDLVILDDELYDVLDRKPGLRIGPSEPDFLVVAERVEAERHAELLATGCLGVVEWTVGTPEFEDALWAVVSRWRRDAEDALAAKRLGQERLALGDFVTSSASMREFMKVARRVSQSDASLLILGETGVGKERLAAAIHAESRRGCGPFVVVNCGAIPESLFESELFGHERGAFTGASRRHRGCFEMAHGGSIMLDEIGEMPLQMQVKLLRVLQERSIRRVGGEESVPVDVRVVAATNRDLEDEVAVGRFRSDLYYRLSVVTLTLPPLRERREDIPLLVASYLERFRTELGRPIREVAPDAMAALMAYHWPGNVREVVNVIERAVLLTEEDRITLAELPDAISSAVVDAKIEPLVAEMAASTGEFDPKWIEVPLREARRAWNAVFERDYLDRLLREESGRVNRVATRAGIDPRSLYTKMRALGLRKEHYR